MHERAELAHRMILSLDEEMDAGAEKAWESELERRVSEIHRGSVKGVPAEEVFSKIKAKYNWRIIKSTKLNYICKVTR